MAKKKLASKKQQNKENQSIMDVVMAIITSAYICIVLIIMPLYAPDAYYDIGDYKWRLWIYSATAYIVVILTLGFIRLIFTNVFVKSQSVSALSKPKHILSGFTVLDWFALAYLLFCIISSTISPFKESVFMGATAFNMGLWSQVCFVGSYFCISRTWKYSKSIIRFAMITATLICIFEILMRFGIDPLSFYVDLTDTQKLDFISTIGQASWYSSYLCILLPIIVAAYYNSKLVIARGLSAVFMIVGFMSLVTQNTDSAYLALAAFMFVLFWVSFETNDTMQRYLEVVIIALISFEIVGAMQVIFAENATKLDDISMKLSQGKWTLIALMTVIVIYVFLRLFDNRIDIHKIQLLRYLVLSIGVIGSVLIMVHIINNTITNESIEATSALASNSNYFVFDNSWGNHRGISWRCAIGTFLSENLLHKLVGAGPDMFAPMVYQYYGYDLVGYFGEGNTLTCAHNEGLNMLITGGLTGLVAYIGMFFSSFIRNIKRYKADCAHLAIAMSIVAYVAHNFFCYQQVVCTSIIMTLFGISEALIRNGHTIFDIWEQEHVKDDRTLWSVVKSLFQM